MHDKKKMHDRKSKKSIVRKSMKKEGLLCVKPLPSLYKDGEHNVIGGDGGNIWVD